MSTRENLKDELAKLVTRNEEIRKLKEDPKFFTITSKSAIEYSVLEAERKVNQKRIKKITEMLGQR